MSGGARTIVASGLLHSGGWRQLGMVRRTGVRELGVGRERENFVVVVVLFCVECRGREEKAKKTQSLSWK